MKKLAPKRRASGRTWTLAVGSSLVGLVVLKSVFPQTFSRARTTADQIWNKQYTQAAHSIRDVPGGVVGDALAYVDQPTEKGTAAIVSVLLGGATIAILRRLRVPSFTFGPIRIKAV